MPDISEAVKHQVEHHKKFKQGRELTAKKGSEPKVRQSDIVITSFLV